ncbi:MAG: InlB B-repeat-containing protein [Actinomycetia bacterium]|nr:InlB B-repeat-containing protein [Actinomycetes bacterium]
MKDTKKSSLARRIALLVTTTCVVAAALTPLVLAPRKAAAAGATPVGNYAELSAALTDSATTGIVLTADITVSSPIQINTAMADGLVIDGKDPGTGQIHTLTETPSGSSTGNIFINSTGTLKNITFTNLIMDGKDYYGFPNINDAVRGLDLTYDNVTYIGPQMTFNRYGAVTYRDCDITIVQNGAPDTPEELAEAARVVFEGTVTVNSATTAHTVIRSDYSYNNTTPGNVEIKPGAVVNISSPAGSYGFLYNNVAANTLIIGGGATFNFSGIAWSTRTDIAAITIGDGTAAQPTTVTIKEPDSTGTSSTDLFRAAQSITIGNYCNVAVTGLPSGSNSGIYAGTALNIGDDSTVEVAINTASGTSNYNGNAIYVGNAAASTGITVGANSAVTARINGNNTGTSGVIYPASTGAASGIHLNGPNSTMDLIVTGASSTYGYQAPGGDVHIGAGCTLSASISGAMSNWAFSAPSTSGAFTLDTGASLILNAPNAATTSTNGGLSVGSTTGIQMGDDAKLQVMMTGYNNTSTNSGNGSLVYVPNGPITTGQNADITVKTIGTNAGVYAAINTRGLSLGTGATATVDLNATISVYGVYDNGATTVGQNATLSIHTAPNVTTRQFLLYMVSGALTVNQGANVRIVAQDAVSNAAYAAVFANAAGMTFNSPKSVVLYNGAGGTLVQYGAQGLFIINNVQQIGLWHDTVSYPPAMASGRFSSLPTYNWRSTAAPNDGLVGATTVSGSITTGTYAALNSISAPGVANTPALARDQGTAAPINTTFFLGYSGSIKSYAIAFGYLPLSASYNSVVNPTIVTGTTDPGSSVVLAKWSGTAWAPVGDTAVADASGNYSLDVQSISNITPNISYAVISSDPQSYLTTEIKTMFFLVTFDANGGTNAPTLPDPFYVQEGATIPPPPFPTNALKHFEGWYADQATTQAFDLANTPIMADTTLYAKWSFASVIIHQTVLSATGDPATNRDYALAGLDSNYDQPFTLVFTDQDTGEVYTVIAYRDRAVTFDCLPTGHTFTVRIFTPQHFAADAIDLIDTIGDASFSAQGPAVGTLTLGADSTLELNFISRIAPAGFGNSQDASNLFKLQER